MDKDTHYNRKKKFKTYKKGQVVYADLGRKAPGVQGGVRPCIVVSRDKSNHMYAPQISVCPLSSKLKDNLVHVRVHPYDVNGFHLRTESDCLPEDIQTIPKSAVIGAIGYVREESGVMAKLDAAMIIHFGLQDAFPVVAGGEE